MVTGTDGCMAGARSFGRGNGQRVSAGGKRDRDARREGGCGGVEGELGTARTGRCVHNDKVSGATEPSRSKG